MSCLCVALSRICVMSLICILCVQLRFELPHCNLIPYLHISVATMAARHSCCPRRYDAGRMIPRTPPDRHHTAFVLSRCDMCTIYFVEAHSDGTPMHLHGKLDANFEYWYCWNCWEWWQEAWSAIYLKWALRWSSTPGVRVNELVLCRLVVLSASACAMSCLPMPGSWLAAQH